jgi:hypothetical protein
VMDTQELARELGHSDAHKLLSGRAPIFCRAPVTACRSLSTAEPTQAAST